MPKPPEHPVKEHDWSEIDRWLKDHAGGPLEGPVAQMDPAKRQELLQYAIAEAQKITKPSWAVHWPDFVMILALVVFIGLAIWQHVAFAPVTQMAIATPGGLAAFHVLSDADLVEHKGPPESGVPTSKDAVRGRYLLQYLKQGSVLHDTQVSTSSGWDARLKDLIILDLPVRLGQTEPPRETSVMLVVSPHAEGAAWSGAVILLAIRRSGNSAWASVALTKEQLDSVKGLLGESDIYLGRIEY